ncbi:MAG: sterol desaturase family protein [Arcobacter sp.]|uniref:sterol desaturase family protein n=1 Tax=Arcobacter sp. TaxID=1872629 RepID=UPI003B007B96
MNDLMVFEYFINPNKRVFWIYIISSIFLAFIYFLYTKKSHRAIFSSKLWLHPSAKLDYSYFFLGYMINAFLLIPLIISAKTIAYSITKFLYLHFGMIENSIFSYKEILFLYTLSLFIFSDFTRYILHRVLHEVPFLWEFHKVHHSAKVLNPLTFYRVHPVENILFGLRYSLSVGFITGIFLYFFGAMIDIYMIFGANIFIVVFSILGSNLRHSHIPFSYGKYLEKIFISPKQHQIHHSKKHFDKNYGGYLAVWDYLFGSLKLSKDVKVLKFGLKKEQMKEYKTILSLLIFPFKNLFNRRQYDKNNYDS